MRIVSEYYFTHGGARSPECGGEYGIDVGMYGRAVERETCITDSEKYAGKDSSRCEGIKWAFWVFSEHQGWCDNSKNRLETDKDEDETERFCRRERLSKAPRTTYSAQKYHPDECLYVFYFLDVLSLKRPEKKKEKNTSYSCLQSNE